MMEQPILTGRESGLLKSLVISFIDFGVPIGSRYLSKLYHKRLSAATIRNVMMDLEEKGLVTQPHTSAGRIPTDLGYRCYVNELMEVEGLSEYEKQQIDHDLRAVPDKDVQEILEKACEILSKVSNYLGIALSPRFYQGRFKKIELVSLSESKLLVVISLSSGLVRTVTMEMKTSIPPQRLETTARILNERLAGLTLKQIREQFEQRLADIAYGDEQLISQLSGSVDRLFSPENEPVYFKGTQNILSYPEFSNQERISKILELIDNQKILIRLIDSSTKADEKISITIGKENKEELVNNCSVITASYRIGDLTGTLGIIGPTRMKYEKVTSLVDYITDEITRLFIQ